MPLSKLIPSLQTLLDTDLDDDTADTVASSEQVAAWAAALDLHRHREDLRHVRRWLSMSHHVVFPPAAGTSLLLATHFGELHTTRLPVFLGSAVAFMALNAWVSHITDLALAATFSGSSAITAWRTATRPYWRWVLFPNWRWVLCQVALRLWWPLCLTVGAISLLMWGGFLLLVLSWMLGVDSGILVQLFMDAELRLEFVREIFSLWQDSRNSDAAIPPD